MIVRVGSGFVVLEIQSIGFAEGFGSFIRGLVEALVGNVTVVGDHCDFHVFSGRNRNNTKEHDCCQQNSKQLFHCRFPLSIFGFSPFRYAYYSKSRYTWKERTGIFEIVLFSVIISQQFPFRQHDWSE